MKAETKTLLAGASVLSVAIWSTFLGMGLELLRRASDILTDTSDLQESLGKVRYTINLNRQPKPRKKLRRLAPYFDGRHSLTEEGLAHFLLEARRAVAA